MWAGVTERFRTFHHNLYLTDDQISEGTDHHVGYAKPLTAITMAFSDLANSYLIGSWGKDTKTRPPRDIDLYFVLPYAVYQRFELVTVNKQSALLQEVRRVLQGTYPNTNLRGDGQVFVQRLLACVLRRIEHLKEPREPEAQVRAVLTGARFQEIKKDVARLEDAGIVGKQAEHGTDEQAFEGRGRRSRTVRARRAGRP